VSLGHESIPRALLPHRRDCPGQQIRSSGLNNFPVLIATRRIEIAASHEMSPSKHALPPLPCDDKEKEASNEITPADSTEAASPRPSGWALNLIVGSIMMAVFLTTLDQVLVEHHLHHRKPHSRGTTPLTRHRQSSAQLCPKSQMNSTASSKSHGTAPCISLPSALSGRFGGRSARTFP
jgi:hypothetical protein